LALDLIVEKRFKTKNMKKLISISVLLSLLLIGTSGFAQRKRVSNGPHEKAKMEEIATALELSAEQREQVETIFKTEKAEMEEQRVAKEVMQELPDQDKRIERAKMNLKRAEAAKLTNALLAEVLTEDQLQKYEAFKVQKRAERRSFKKSQEQHKLEKPDMHQQEPKSKG
jgi:methionine-rich copper-binding protein CopC